MIKKGGWTVSNYRNLISVIIIVITNYNELKRIGVCRYISLWSNTTYGLDISLDGVKVSAHHLFNLFCWEVVAKSGNSNVCSSHCYYSENTKLNRKVAWKLCSPLEGKHLCLVSDACDPSCSRKMYLKFNFQLFVIWFIRIG